MSTSTRNRYSAEFKAKVALDAIKGELTILQLGAKYGAHQTSDHPSPRTSWPAADVCSRNG